MKNIKKLLPFVLVLFLSACTTFAGGIKSTGMDKSYDLVKFDIDEPTASVNNYFTRGFINFVDESQPSIPVQGVKFKWNYNGYEVYTTVSVSKVVCDPTGSEVPEFKVEWSRTFMKDTAITYDDVFQTGSFFNPNSLFENPDFYSAVIFKMDSVSCNMLSDMIYRLQ